MLGLGKFNRILDIDFDNRTVTAQPGVTNLGITRAVEHAGFYYAPDPSSQIACTIGGNVAENSGGVHCLKYGLTTNNVLGVVTVLPNGEIVRLGGKHLDSDGYDLLGVMTGSEGLLGVVTEVTVRILQKPETARAVLIGFPTVEQGGGCVASIIAAGIIPGGLEMMDRPAINAAEDFVARRLSARRRRAADLRAGRPGGRGRPADRRRGGDRPPARRHLPQGQRERGGAAALLGRPQGRLPGGRPASRPTIYCMDGTIPRGQLPHVLQRMREMSEHYGLRVANVFHAGDGNLHPLIMYDANLPGELRAGRGVRRRHPEALRRGRRRADRRARRRHREARPDAGRCSTRRISRSSSG